VPKRSTEDSPRKHCKEQAHTDDQPGTVGSRQS
jgi:hypothetical protein